MNTDKHRSLIYLSVFICVHLWFYSIVLARPAENAIRLNTVGFLPDHEKRASIAARCEDFRVISESDGAAVFRGKATGPVRNADTDEELYIADFTTLKQPGVYRLDVPGVGRSAPFRIGRDVYHFPFYAVTRAMYLWRCGAAVRGTHDGITYSHAACHLDDAWLDFVGGGHTRRDATKGWHDAGDYNKYVVNAGVTVGIMFLAWEQYGPHIQKIRLDLPESIKGLPDYLSEIKWEIDWLLTMQAPDSSVYHKISTKEFGPAIQPEQEKTERYFAPWSSAATADFVAMTAMAARIYEPYDKQYARRCLEAARRSYAFLLAHPEDHRADLKGFSTGAYQTADSDDRLWAAAEMWETTGERVCLSDFEARARNFSEKFKADWGWSEVRNLGMLTYLFSKRDGRSSELVKQIAEELTRTADQIVRTRDTHGYARPLGTVYYWGCNGGVANTTVLLQSANRLGPNREYVETTLDALAHLFGRNYYGRSFVTGLGANPPLNPHDRRSMDQPGARAWPGYLVGGGWPKATDWKDEAPLYRVNEIAINWNAPLIYALASVLF
ncbi:MAG TPA: glycoside hydrolase family 9 protein [Blastocatellia bacterium]|nr:glycoside hydrolase family 9 protein [Blastocatellia bacterium]